MADIEWKPLPTLWPRPAVYPDAGEFMLLVFTQDGVPTWEVCLRSEASSSRTWPARVWRGCTRAYVAAVFDCDTPRGC